MKVRSLMITAAVAAVGLISTAAQAATTFDIGYTGTGPALFNGSAVSTTAAAAKTNFLSNLNLPYLIETFSDKATGGFSSLPLTFAKSDALGTVVSPPSGTLSASPGSAINAGALSNWGNFGGLATTDGLGANKWAGFFSTFTMTFAPNQSHVGFLLNDVSDTGARTITLNWSGGASDTITIGSSTSNLSNNNVYFIGASRTAATIQSVTISGAISSDGIALDDIILGGPSQAGVPIPLPASVWAGIALMGLTVVARRFHQRA